MVCVLALWAVVALGVEGRPRAQKGNPFLVALDGEEDVALPAEGPGTGAVHEVTIEGPGMDSRIIPNAEVRGNQTILAIKIIEVT